MTPSGKSAYARCLMKERCGQPMTTCGLPSSFSMGKRRTIIVWPTCCAGSRPARATKWGDGSRRLRWTATCSRSGRRRFGTQFVPGAKGEMTQGEYKNELLSNSIRAAMCVRAYEKQVEQVKQAQKQPETADFNTGQFPCP